jgi:hypothetical protein
VDYDEQMELRSYVVRYLNDRLTESERQRVVDEVSHWKGAGLIWFKERARARAAGEGEPEWRPPVPTPGYVEFLDQVVARVLREDRLTIVIDRCPKCNAVLRTPAAKLCLWCGHSQYAASS